MGRLSDSHGDGFWYLATVYTSHPEGLDVAYRDARVAAVKVLRLHALKVFCPIMHSHPMCAIYGTPDGLHDALDHDFWMAYDEPFMRAAAGLLVVQMPNWENSRGIAHEIGLFRRLAKPIYFLDWPDLRIAGHEF